MERGLISLLALWLLVNTSSVFFTAVLHLLAARQRLRPITRSGRRTVDRGPRGFVRPRLALVVCERTEMAHMGAGTHDRLARTENARHPGRADLGRKHCSGKHVHADRDSLGGGPAPDR